MKIRVDCASAHCLHNEAGGCAAPVIRIEERVTPEGGAPFCATFAKSSGETAARKLRAQALEEGFRYEFADLEAAGTIPFQGPICCVMHACRFHEAGLCTNQRITIGEPVAPSSIVCPCMTYFPQ